MNQQVLPRVLEVVLCLAMWIVAMMAMRVQISQIHACELNSRDTSIVEQCASREACGDTVLDVF